MGGLLKLCGSPKVLCAFATQMFMMPLNEMNSLMPLFLVESVGLSQQAAASVATAYPLGAIVSMVASGVLFDKLGDSGRAVMFGLQNVLAIASFQLLPAASSPAVVAAAMFTAMVGTAPTIFLAPSGLLSRLASPRYSGTVIGLCDAPGFFAGMVRQHMHVAFISS
jgi:sugar phosphate permease